MKEIKYPYIKSPIKITEEGAINYDFFQNNKKNFGDKIKDITSLKFTKKFLEEYYSEMEEILLSDKNDTLEKIIEIEGLILIFLAEILGIEIFSFDIDFYDYFEKKLLNSNNIIATFNDIFLDNFLYFLDKNDFGKTPYIDVSYEDIKKYDFNDFGKIIAYLDNGKLNFKFEYNNKNKDLITSSFKNSIFYEKDKENFQFIQEKISTFFSYILENKEFIFLNTILEHQNEFKLIKIFIYENILLFKKNKILNNFRQFFQYITLNRFLIISDYDNDIKNIRELIENTLLELDKNQTKLKYDKIPPKYNS